MLQQHGLGYRMPVEKPKSPVPPPETEEIPPVINEFDERHRKQGIDAARALASQYRSRVTENKDANQRQAARELSRTPLNILKEIPKLSPKNDGPYVRNELKDEPNAFSEAFLNAIDGRTEGASHNAVYNCVKSSNVDQKKAGIYLIVCLAETHAGNVIRYANYLLKMLNSGGMDEEAVKLAAKALAFLIATCKSYAAELVDRCLDHCQEWLILGTNLPATQNREKNILDLDENRRLAASHLSRELALATPTAFFLRVNLFFKYIFNAVRDKNPAVRIAAIDALHVVLTIVSQREAKNKTEWFKECFQEALTVQTNHLSKDEYDRWHSVALILNELLRISDSRFELIRCESSQFIKQKFLKEDEEDGVEWLVLNKQQVIVESVTARKLVVENFQKILDVVRQMIPLTKTNSKSISSIYLNTVLMQLLPRICAFPQCDRTFQTLAFETASNVVQKNAVAAPALGMMMLSNPDVHAAQINKTINFISGAIKKTTNPEILDSYFTFLFLFVDSYHEQVTTQIKAIIPQLMEITLSRSLANVLKMIMMRIPKLRLNVQDGVMASVYFTLTGTTIPPKSSPQTDTNIKHPRAILQKAETDPVELQRIVLAIDVLGEFYFSRGALQRIMQFVADNYLTAGHVEIRLAAVSSCCEMIVPFVSVYKKVTSDKRTSLLNTIYGVLRAVCSVIVNDPDVRVRMQVITCFGQMPRPFLAHLAQPEMLEVQFMALHDERLEMQQACVTLLGRLAELNPALVLPRLRLMLLETLSQMMQSGQGRLEQHSAKMIGQLAKQSPKFMRPYVGSLMIAMLPKMRNEQKFAEVTAQVLNAVSEISVIGGAEIVKNLKMLFDKLTHMINDSSNLHKREAALRAIGGICRSTAYVVDPYRDYPTLLDDLLRILKTVMSNTMRRECIKTLGILGAIDPYTHKVFTGSVLSSTAISTALSLPITETDSKDPRQDIIHWFNYEKCTLEEFYPAITIANLMLMMQDEDSQSYAEIAQAIVTIFRSLGDMAPLYTEQVVPRLIEVCKRATASNNRASLREFFLQQLSIFVAIIKKHAAPYMPAIFTIIADAWKEDISVKMVVIQVLTEMGTAIGNDFSKYTGELIPYLLTVLQTDKTKERILTVKVMESIRPLTHCIVQHLHLVLPPLLIILDDVSLKLCIRETALDTVLHMTQQVDVSAYAPRMMQSWHHNISTPEMRDKLLEAIEYKTRPERRPRIALLWSRRLQGCRRNVEQWQRLIMLRGLVLSPQEMHPLRVKFSSMCRKQGKNSMSRAVLRELLNLPTNADLMGARAPYDKPLLVLALAKQLYQDDQKDAAIRALEELANHWNKRVNPIPQPSGKELVPPSTKEPARICAKVLLKLGEWTEVKSKNASLVQSGELSFVRQQVSPQYRTKDSRTPETIAFENTINYYNQASKYDPEWHKVWHKLASTHFNAVVREKTRFMAAQNTHLQINGQSKAPVPNKPVTPPPPPAQKSPQIAPFHSNNEVTTTTDYPVPAPLGSLVGLPAMPSHYTVSSTSSKSPTPSQQSSSNPGQLSEAGMKHAAAAITCFAKALMCSPGSRLEDTLRLMQLWFDHADNEIVYKAIAESIFDLPVTSWLEAIPQLMARLDSSKEKNSVKLVLRVLCEIAKYLPQALIYALTVASRSSDCHRRENASIILAKMIEYHQRLVQEANLVTEELVRCAILWHEQWHDALDDASRVYFHRRLQDNNVTAMFDALKNMNTLMQKGPPTTMKEHSFQQTYSADLKEAGQYVQAFESSQNVKDLNQAWEIYCSVFKKLRDQLATLNSLDLVYVSPNLVSSKDLELVVPGTYDPSAPVVTIQSFSSKMSVITSKQRPRKMVIRGSNGLDYQFLLKGHEDPRQDERVMQLFGLVNTLLANNSETCRRNLTIQRYSIVALSKDSGLIGWVPNCDTLHTLVKEYREKKAKIPLSIEHKTLQKLSVDTEHLTVMQKLQLFESALSVTQGEDLRQVLWLKSPSSEVWFDRRTNYTRSVACMSMVGYILGLGDRHPSNLMLDRLTGKIVHIDFGDCFEVAMLREKFPERVPFRLTRMLINAMEVTGLDGVYNYTAERVLKMLRTNQESLLAVLEAFVYDPVINWRLVEGMKKNPTLKKDNAPRLATTNAILPSTTTTDTIMETIKRKLNGTEFVHNDPSTTPEALPVTDQLAMLTDQATSSINLCQSYIGWCPFW
ncbi:hypothetical protein CAEBREN_03943 [Caenorhabditis brenneri]|uniref:non-specific serine/threonine protein kinase n=1 Tax=Caenorhabditis brenneri TaxID=135651 RepID=G0NHF1_CAEBE|nr:hypothetical protein CAEBREN_03943 [Caenorhabditis brenneri]